MTIIPSIDLRHGKLVRLQQGDYDRQLDYDLDPIATAQSFARAGAQWMHLVDLDGARQGRCVQIEQIRQIIASCGLLTSVGGGVRSTDDVEHLLAAGATRVVIGTKAIEDWPWFESLVRRPDLAGKLVLALDAHEGKVAVRGWTKTSNLLAIDIAARIRNWPVAAILYTDVARDGMLQGPNLITTRALAEATDVPVIASGGVGHIDHIRQLMDLPIWGVIVGRSLHEGKLDLAQALRMAG